MPNNVSLSQLSGHRAVLLGCEAIGWLHMTGKAHPDFLRQHGGQHSGYKFKDWANTLVPDWDSTLAWLSNSKVLRWPNLPSDFLSQFDGGKSQPSVLGLLQAGHAMASSIEKNHPSNTTKYLGQDTTHMWLTTAFGHPVRNLLEDPPEVLQEGGWDELLGKLIELLQGLRDLGTKNPAPSTDEWHVWRQSTIGKNGWLRRAFSQTIAETRVPNNDVTLWDQSYVAAALFKSAVAGALLQGNGFNWTSLKQNTRWRVLTVGVGTLHYEARAVRVGDWTGAQREIDRFFEAVCKLVEVELAVGSLLYRDDELLAFSFPGRPVGDNDLANVREPLREQVQKQVDGLARHLDTPPVVRLSGSTRSMICLAREVEEARKTLRVPLHRSWQPPQNEIYGHTCPVCGVRPNGSSGARGEGKEKPCGPCAERRRGRLGDWLGGRVEGDSIWISEVADGNDRVALLTLGFDIAKWLDGENVDSLRAQSLVEMLDANPELRKALPETPNDLPFSALQTAITNYVRNPRKDNGKLSDPLLSSLNDGFRHETDLAAFFEKIVQDRADAPSWDELNNHDSRRAEWIAHQLLRKNASPGRVRRFWETTEVFFNELLAEFRQIVSRNANRWQVRRLILTAKNGKWKDKATYLGHWGMGDDAVPLELVYREDSKDFITICNLARIVGPGDDPTILRDQKVEVVDEEGTRHTLVVQKVSEAPAPLGTYHPLIVLVRSPRRFRLLVPLEAVDACVQAAVEKWRKEFSRVWDRLPLRVGIVGFPRKLPYQAVVEAARNLESELDRSEPETWRVREVRTFEGVTSLSMVRPDGEPQLVTVPVALADGRPDVFYPYCAVQDSRVREAHDFAAPLHDPTSHLARQVYRWMPELRPGDGVRVAPSRVARVFLDSTARRFEPVRSMYLADWQAARDVWCLAYTVAPSMTALRNVEAALADARERWTDPDGHLNEQAWLAFVRATLVDCWDPPPAALDALIDAARCGFPRQTLLEETLCWHLHVLKLSPEEGV